jgi:hypothetical protein
MTLTNKTKTNVTLSNPNKGIGAEWGDNYATWGDTQEAWGAVEVLINKIKSIVSMINKTKTNV